MRSTFAIVTTAAVIASSAPVNAQQNGPDTGAPSPMVNLPVDHSLTNSPCGTLESTISAVCRHGMVYNKEGDVERKQELQTRALAEVRSVTEERKTAAKKLADRVLAGASVPPALVDQVRSGLNRDLELWRAESGVDDKAWNAAKARWLLDPSALTPSEWVLWRAAWFDERDKWIAQTSKRN